MYHVASPRLFMLRVIVRAVGPAAGIGSGTDGEGRPWTIECRTTVIRSPA